MALGVFQTVLQLITKDDASQGMNNAGKAAKRLKNQIQGATDSFGNLAGAYTKLLVAGKAKQAFQAMIAPAMEFEVSQKKFAALTKASTEDLALFTKTVKAEVMQTPYDLKDTAEAMLLLRKATGSTVEATKALSGAANLAMASFDKVDMVQASKALGEVSRTFGGIGLDEASDKMIRASQAAGIGIEEYIEIMGRLGAANVTGGQTFDQVLSAFSLVRSAGWSASRASNMLIRTFSDLQRGKADAAFAEIGVSLRKDNDELLSMDDILKQLFERYQKMPTLVQGAMQKGIGQFSQKEFSALFSRMSRGIYDLEGNLHKGTAALDYFSKMMKDSTGAGEEFRKKYLEMGQTKIQLMWQSLANLAEELGQGFLPAIKGAAISVTWLINNFTKLITAVKPLASILTGIGILFAAGGVIWAGRLAFQGMSKILAVVSVTAKGMIPPLVRINAESAMFETRWMRLARTGAGSVFNSVGAGLMQVGRGLSYIAKNAIVFAAISEGFSAFTKGWSAWSQEWEGNIWGISLTIREALGQKTGGVTGKEFVDQWYKTVESDPKLKAALTAGFITKGRMNDIIIQQVLERKKAAALEVKSAEALRTAAEKMNTAFAFGSKSMNEILTRTEKLMSWEPPVVKVRALQTLEKKYHALSGKGMVQGDKNRLDLVRKGLMPQMKDLLWIQSDMNKKKRDWTPKEATTARALANQIGIATKHFETLKVFKKGTTKGYIDDFEKGIAGGMSESSRMAGTTLAAQAGGRTAGPIKEWDAAKGGYKGSPLKMLGGLIDNVYGNIFGKPTPDGADVFTEKTAPEGYMAKAVVGAIGNLPRDIGREVAKAVEYLLVKLQTGQDPQQSDANSRGRPFQGQSR